jgi:hypothetical protein
MSNSTLKTYLNFLNLNYEPTPNLHVVLKWVPKLEVLGLSFVKIGNENKCQNETKGWGGGEIKLVFSSKLVLTRSFTPSFGFVLAAPSLLAHILHQIKSSHVKLKSCQCCEFIASFIEPYLVALTLGLHANWGWNMDHSDLGTQRQGHFKDKLNHSIGSQRSSRVKLGSVYPTKCTLQDHLV